MDAGPKTSKQTLPAAPPLRRGSSAGGSLLAAEIVPLYHAVLAREEKVAEFLTKYLREINNHRTLAENRKLLEISPQRLSVTYTRRTDLEDPPGEAGFPRPLDLELDFSTPVGEVRCQPNKQILIRRGWDQSNTDAVQRDDWAGREARLMEIQTSQTKGVAEFRRALKDLVVPSMHDRLGCTSSLCTLVKTIHIPQQTMDEERAKVARRSSCAVLVSTN